jgi:hypothetical protein
MAKKIEWTETAIQDRFKIYEFWVENNKSDTYSKKLENLFKKAAHLISEFPEIGIKTKMDLIGQRPWPSVLDFFENQYLFNLAFTPICSCRGTRHLLR